MADDNRPTLFSTANPIPTSTLAPRPRRLRLRLRLFGPPAAAVEAFAKETALINQASLLAIRAVMELGQELDEPIAFQPAAPAAEAKRTQRTAPAATSLEHVVRRVPQCREAAPDVDAADSDAPANEDAVLQRLIEAACPTELARLQAMPPDQRRSLLRLAGEQHAHLDRARLRKRA